MSPGQHAEGRERQRQHNVDHWANGVPLEVAYPAHRGLNWDGYMVALMKELKS